MTYPFFVGQHPDHAPSGPILGNEQRAILDVMVRRPGKVLTVEQLGADLTPFSRSNRRVRTLIDGIRDTLGEDIVEEIPRRGFRYVPVSGKASASAE